MAGLYSDVKFAFRSLARNPLVSLVAVASLAIGIGANTAIFSLIDQLILRLLPVDQPDQLVMIWSTGPHLGNNNGQRAASYPMYQDFQQKAPAFSSVFCRYETPASLSTGDHTERVSVELVSGNYFQALGVKPALGRVFHPAEDDRVYKGHPVVVLSHAFWASRFNSDPSVIGRKVLINNYPMTIVGVSQAGFAGLDPSRAPQIRVPIQMKPILTPGRDDLGNRRSQWIQIFARMKPGFTVKSAQASLQPLFHQILEQELQQKELADISAYNRARFLKRTVQMEPAATGYSQTRNRVSVALVVLMCMVGMVLMIACFNVANLLIARAVARQKEIAVRMALGASRLQLIRQLLVESMTLSLVGGVLGVALSVWTIKALLAFVPSDGRIFLITATPDLRILAFTVALALGTGFVFGMAPALQSTRLDVWTVLKDAGSAVTRGGHTVSLRKILVTAQIALSFLLLAGAGLFVKSLSNLRTAQTGFRDLDTLVTFQVDPARNGYSVERLMAFHRQLLDRLRTAPGVKSAGTAAMALLHGGEWDSTMSVEGHHNVDGENLQAFMNAVSPGYFETMGVPLLQGRDFEQRDRGDQFKVAVVNRAFADHFFGNASPLGRHIGFGSGPKTKLEIEIVGVVDNSMYEGPREGVHRQVFVAAQESGSTSSLAYYIRAAGSPDAIAGMVRKEVATLDAAMPVYEVTTLSRQLDETLSAERLIAVLSAAFGFLATLLAAIGLYGVMAFLVERRTKELGLRMALGAEASRVVWLVLREVLMLLGIGLAVGVPAAYLLSRYVSSQLFGVAPADLLTAIEAIGVLAVVATLAGFLPARRASSIDPMQALRYE